MLLPSRVHALRHATVLCLLVLAASCGVDGALGPNEGRVRLTLSRDAGAVAANITTPEVATHNNDDHEGPSEFSFTSATVTLASVMVRRLDGVLVPLEIDLPVDVDVVKLEGGRRMGETIRFLTDRGIPVMAHIGLTPQSINVIGGFKTQGRVRDEWAAIEEDAKTVADAGAFSIVLEAMAEELARKITAAIPIPTIGIGASAGCDGQILVMEDMLGLSPRVPKFVKQFGKVGEAIREAISAYSTEVRNRTFPGDEHTYAMKDGAKAAQKGKGKAAKTSA